MAGALAAGPGAAEEGIERAARVEEVRRAEITFAASLRANRLARYAARLADDAVFVVGGGETKGREAIVAAWEDYFGEARFWFERHPEAVEPCADGSLGLTRGPWAMRTNDAQGDLVERRGFFNSVCREAVAVVDRRSGLPARWFLPR